MGRERIRMDVGNGNTAGQAFLSAPLRERTMRRTAVLLVILMLTSVAASMSNGYWMVNEPSQMGSSSGASCTNQTHSGGAFYADIVTGNDSWAGTSDCPTASIQVAVDLAGEGVR